MKWKGWPRVTTSAGIPESAGTSAHSLEYSRRSARQLRRGVPQPAGKNRAA
ncbi:hypothetical protein ZHAS_00007995 [Anopheles sinensis]|uniref:Uncharacterized protein n=1 Tax=Anopheles sinensis TaxID=74873 RepID=A0A084VRA9_ANOSI|nr:hypothetical protein ZHAS_00007995 [Anopheles sinensis]